MRAEFYLMAAFAFLACGGRLSSESASPPDGGGGDAVASADTGLDSQPMDASALPTTFVMDCRGAASPIGFKLPCVVNRGVEEDTACYAFDDGSVPPRPVLLFWVPLRYMAAHLNEPINLSDIPQPPLGFLGSLVSGGVDYRLTHIGALTVSQVDPVAGTYIGRLDSVEFIGKADGGDAIACSATGAVIWARPGIIR
jgi:hypothetical protein